MAFDPNLFEPLDEGIAPGTPAQFRIGTGPGEITPQDRQRVIDRFQVAPVGGAFDPAKFEPISAPAQAPATPAVPKPRFTPEWAARENAKDQPSLWDIPKGMANKLGEYGDALIADIAPNVKGPGQALMDYEPGLKDLQKKFRATGLDLRTADLYAELGQKMRTAGSAVFSILPPAVNKQLEPLMKGIADYTKVGLKETDKFLASRTEHPGEIGRILGYNKHWRITDQWADIVSEFMPDLAMLLGGAKVARVLHGAKPGSPLQFVENARDSLMSEYRTADVQRQTAILAADQRIAAWQDQAMGGRVTRYPPREIPLAETAEESRLRRFTEVERGLRDPREYSTQAEGPPRPIPDVLREATDALQKAKQTDPNARAYTPPDEFREGMPPQVNRLGVLDVVAQPTDIASRTPDVRPAEAAQRALYEQQQAAELLRREAPPVDVRGRGGRGGEGEAGPPKPPPPLPPTPPPPPDPLSPSTPPDQAVRLARQAQAQARPRNERGQFVPDPAARLARVEAENARLRAEAGAVDPLSPPGYKPTPRDTPADLVREAEQTRVSKAEVEKPTPKPEATLDVEGKAAPKTAEELARDAETLRGHQEELGMVKEAAPEPQMTLMTRQKVQQLLDLGYTRDQVSKFKPDLADRIIAAQQGPPTKAAAPEPGGFNPRPRRFLNEMDAAHAPDIEYRDILSTGARDLLKKGETWRSRVEKWADYEDQKKADFQKEAAPKPPTPIEMKEPRKGTHLSSNVESLQAGFEQRDLGISVARGLAEEQTSPTTGEPVGTKARVNVEVTGKGLDYANRTHHRYIDQLMERVGPPFDTNTIKALREQGIAWVDNWNGIGKANELHVIDPKAVKITGQEPYVRRKVADLPLDQPVIERRGRSAAERAESTERIRRQQGEGPTNEEHAAMMEEMRQGPSTQTPWEALEKVRERARAEAAPAERPGPTDAEIAEVQRLRQQGRLAEAQGPVGEVPQPNAEARLREQAAAAVGEPQKQAPAGGITEFDFGPEVAAQVAARAKLRVAWKVDGTLDPEFIGKKGEHHGSNAEMTAKLIEADRAGRKIQDGFVDDAGKWYDNLEAYEVAQMTPAQKVRKATGGETGAVGQFTPEQARQAKLAREARKALFRDITEFARTAGTSVAEAARDHFPEISPTAYRKLVYEDAIDRTTDAMGRAATKLVKINQRAQELGPEAENVAATGHVSREARTPLWESWGRDKPDTYRMKVSQYMKDAQQHEMIDASRELNRARRIMERYAGNDKTTAAFFDQAQDYLNKAQKDFNRESDRFSKISAAVARTQASRRFAPPIPEDVIENMREAGIRIEAGRKLKERIPLYTNMLNGVREVVSERSVNALSGEQWRKLWADTVNAERFNLFAPFSPVLDLVSNASELGAYTASGFGGDMVHIAKGHRSLPNTSGVLRAIGFKRIGNYYPGEGVLDPSVAGPRGQGWRALTNNPMFEFSKGGSLGQAQLQERLGHTFAGEGIPGNRTLSQLINRPSEWRSKGVFQTGEQGVFTRRGQQNPDLVGPAPNPAGFRPQLSAGMDTLPGAVMYAKSAMDTGFKNIGGNAVGWREAFMEADRQGLKGMDRHRFVQDFWNNISEGTMREMETNANKAGWNRNLTHWEERVSRSNVVKLFFDPFARWSFQFSRWGAEMLGYDPTVWNKWKQGTLSGEEAGRYFTRMATGVGGIYLIDQMFNNNPEGHMDYNSGEWVDHKTRTRQRVSSWEPIMTGLMMGQVVQGAAAYARGEQDAANEHFSKALGITRYASVPFIRWAWGDSGLLGGTMGQLRDGVFRGNLDTRRLKEEFTDQLNRAIPGQAIFSFMKSVTDPTLREGFGSRLPGVSYLKDERINMATGGSIEPMQRVNLPFNREISIDLPAIGGTPFPGAQRVIEPVAGLLSQYGLLEYRGPRMPVAGFRSDEIPEDVSREWQREFGRARSQVLGPLVQAIRVAESKNPASNQPGTPFYDRVRKIIQQHDQIAARAATDRVSARHPFRPKPKRQLTVQEVRNLSEAR